MNERSNIIAEESSRIERVYSLREKEIDRELYAPWQAAENLMVSERKRVAAELLFKAGKFPKKNDKCLEIGYGRLGWLSDLISWGIDERNLHGIELNAERAACAQQALPVADLRIGDATNLPWEDETFDFTVMSTVFSSVLSDEIRLLIAGEIRRVLRSGGVLIWYDLAVNNPKNNDVIGIGSQKLSQLFDGFEIILKSVTLAPPLARFIAPKSFALAAALSAIPFLRTHKVGILIKK